MAATQHATPRTPSGLTGLARPAAAILLWLAGACAATTSPAPGSAPPIAPPTLVGVNPTSGAIAGGTVVTVSGTGFREGVAVAFGAAPATAVTFVAETQLTAVTPPGGAGAVTVTVTNPDGQADSLQAAFTYVATPPPAPTLTAVAPTSGTTAGGTPVTLTGTNFRAGATVRFGAAAATAVVVVSGTSITAHTPAGAAGAVAVTVTNADATSATLPAGFTYAATPPPSPTLTAVTPTSGTTAGGTPVTLTGTNFRAGATVRFGAAAATAVVVVSGTSITAHTPAGAAGPVAVTVTNSDAQVATLAAGFTYVAAPPPAPTLTAVAPTSGPLAGGTAVTLTGTNFRAGATVRFGAAAATAVVVASATRITAVTPAGAAGAVAVTVTNSDAQAATLPAAFTYQAAPAPPTLTAVAPNSGSTAGGTAIALTGTNFRAGATVRVGAAAATAVVVASATRVTAVTPAAAAGTVAVTVTNSDATSATLPSAFTYVTPPPPGACASEPLGSGTVYYVCDCQAGAEAGCVAGVDTAAGTSAAAPWRTFAKAMGQFKVMAAGATVAFCKGGSWTGAGEAQSNTGTLRNAACTAAAPCTMRDYQAAWGGVARPRIQLGAGRTFATLGNYNATAYTWRGLRFWNLEILGLSADGTATAETGFNFCGGVTDVDLCNLELHHGLAFAVNFVVRNTAARVTLRDSWVHDNRGDNICVVCGGADDLLISGNTFDWNGQGNNRSHTIYFSGDAGWSSPSCANGSAPVAIGAYGPTCVMNRITLRGNVIRRSAWGPAAGKCMGVAVVAHDAFDAMVIEDNLITEPAGTADLGCYGIQFNDGGDETARSTNMVVRRNRIFNVGGNGIAVSGAPGVVIENNLVAGGSNLSNCVAYPEQAADAALRDLVSSNGRVRNNTCYLPGGGDGSAAFSGVNEGTGHVFANNAIVSDRCLGAPAGTTLATNLCSTTGAGWWVAPGLDPATADFHPATGSVLLGGGTAAWAPAADLLGVTRGNPPSVGAYER